MVFGQNNNINLEQFPIIEYNGGIINLFKGFAENDIILQLRDCTIATIINDGSGKITIGTGELSSLMQIGNKITIVGGLYNGKTGEITGVTATFLFDVDIDYIGDDSSIIFGFINRLENNYKLEYRFITSDTKDVQSLIPILTDSTFTIFNDSLGQYIIDANLMRGLLTPNFEIIDSDNSSMNKVYQIQLREVENNVILGDWETIYNDSILAFEQFIICHSTGFNAAYEINNKILDIDLESRIWRGYDKIISHIKTDANSPPSLLTFSQLEYAQNLSPISNSSFVKRFDNGINYFIITITNDNARYLQLEETYNGSQLNLTVYDTLLDDTEYYLTWISENGTFRSWLFNAVNSNEYEYNKSTIESIRFRDIPTQANRVVTLITKGLTLNEFNYIKSMLATNLMRVENDGNIYECSVNSDSISYENKKDTYDFEFELNIKPINTMKA